MAKSSKKRSQGGGRKTNSEPRVQVFRDFAGCNFNSSPCGFTIDADDNDEEQSDLQMNYVVIQNNVEINDSRTLETRNNIEKLFDGNPSWAFTHVVLLVRNWLFSATSDGNIRYGKLGTGVLDKSIQINRKPGTSQTHVFQSLIYADDKIIGLTKENEMFTCPVFFTRNNVPTADMTGNTVSQLVMTNASEIPNPPAPTFENSLQPHGDLKISKAYDEEHPHRMAIEWSYVGEFGPTKCSDPLAFYANHPIDEWHSGCYLTVKGNTSNADVKAVEIYYVEANAQSFHLAGRSETTSSNSFSFDWFGYLDSTSMWTIANLIAPTENYTKGVHASHVTCIDGRMYFWGDEDHPERLYIGGNPGNLLSISSGTGGGFVDVEPGTGQEIRVVDKYKTQSGNSIVTMLCDSRNSNLEQRYNLVENTITISNEQNMKGWQAEQVSGAVGCKSYYGAKVCEDGLYSISRYGLALTTMTMEYNSQIRANYVSSQIKPVFTSDIGKNLFSDSVLLEQDGVLYMALGSIDDPGNKIDNIVFCYDIDMKSWWTMTLHDENGIVDDDIIHMFHVDSDEYCEGIGFITKDAIYVLPLTSGGSSQQEKANFDVTIKTGEISTKQPQQDWFYLSQLEFRFDYLVGDLDIEVTGIDQFGRKIRTVKKISYDEMVYDQPEYIRIDQRMRCYVISITGKAKFRITHFMAKLYLMSARQGLVWGFDSSQSHRRDNDIHPTFVDYNDVRKSIIP